MFHCAQITVFCIRYEYSIVLSPRISTAGLRNSKRWHSISRNMYVKTLTFFLPFHFIDIFFFCIYFFGPRRSFPPLPWDFTVLHNDPAVPQVHCGRLRIRTRDLKSGALPIEPPHLLNWATTSPIEPPHLLLSHHILLKQTVYKQTRNIKDLSSE